MRSFQKFLPLLLFHILLWFSNLTDAVPTGTKNQPAVSIRKPLIGGRVGVELDQPLAVCPAEAPVNGNPNTETDLESRLIWMAYWRVPEKLKDMQLVQIGMDGFMDILKNAIQYGINKKAVPSIMTVFHSGNDLIIASSQKGGNALAYTRSTGIDLLVAACLKPDVLKSMDAKCGEMTAAQLWQRIHPNERIETAKIITVTIKSRFKAVDLWKTTEDDLTVHPPCSFAEEGNGCDQLVGPGKILDREVQVDDWKKNIKEREMFHYVKTGWVQTEMATLSFAVPIQIS